MESEELYKEIIRIKRHQQNQDRLLSLLVRKDRDGIARSMMRVFGKSKRRALVYIAVDGQRSVRDIGVVVGVVMPNVSAELRVLRENGLVEKDADGIYSKTFENHVPLVPLLEQEFCLGGNKV